MTDNPAESAVERYFAQRDAIRLDQGPTYGVLETRADDAIAELQAENEALRREVEALKCCPNCGHMTDYNAGSDEEFIECHLVRAIPDRETRSDWDYMDGCCYFTPSRWQRRES